MEAINNRHINPVSAFNAEAVKADPPTFSERAVKTIKEPVLRLWHRFDDHHKGRMIVIAALAVIFIGLPAMILFEKVQPLIERLEELVCPDYARSWMGMSRLMIAAHEFINHISGLPS